MNDHLVQRLASLEAEQRRLRGSVRRHRLALVAVSVLGGAAVLLGATGQMPGSLKVTELEVVDGAGETIVYLGQDDAGGVVQVWSNETGEVFESGVEGVDPVQSPVVELRADTFGGIVDVNSTLGTLAARTEVGMDAVAMLNTFDPQSNAIVSIGSDAFGGIVAVNSPDVILAATMEVGAYGGMLTAQDAEAIRSELGVSEEGDGFGAAYDSDGEMLGSFGAAPVSPSFDALKPKWGDVE